MRILIDMDEVLCQWSNAVMRAWNAAHPDLTVHEVTRWDTNGFLGHPEARYFSRALMLKPEFWEELIPVPGAISGMRRLVASGHEVRIATQVLPEIGGASYEGKLRWLRLNLPEFPLEHFYTLKHKHELRADFLFDDAPHQLEGFKKSGTPVAMDYAWNRDVDCMRVSDWTEFTDFIGRCRVG